MCDKNSAVNPKCSAAKLTPAMEKSATMTNTELLQAIDDILSTPDERDMDIELLNYYTDVLDQRAPVNYDYDPEAAWKRFVAKHPDIVKIDEPDAQTVVSFEPTRARRSGKAILRLFEVAVLLMVITTITVSAFGFSPIKAVVQWVEDIILMHNLPSGTLELPDGTLSEYRSLREALDANGFSNVLSPTWIPAAYDVSDILVKSVGAIQKFSAFFLSEQGEIMVSIVLANNIDGASIAEREEDSEIVLVVDGIEWMISYNADILTGYCQIENWLYSIAGDMSQSELETIIKSMKKG